MSQYVCMRCTRQLVRQQSSTVRTISSSATNKAGYHDLSQPVLGNNEDASSQTRKPSAFGAMIDRAQADREAGRVPLHKYTVHANQGVAPARLPDGTPRSVPIYRVDGAPLEGSVLRGRGGTPAGQLLRRRAPSPSAGASQRSAGGRFLRGGGARPGRGRGERRGRPQRARDDGERDEMDAATEAEIEEQIYGGPMTPKVAIPYNPLQMTLDDFKADWPNTPLSVTGLVGSVQQKAEVLARRLPHGYISPDQLAERFEKGELVRFESVEERDKVLAKAAELAKARSRMLTDRTGETVEASDMTFSSIEKKEGKELALKMCNGVYAALEKQRTPFLERVLQNLRNNGTYHDEKQDEFMAKIASFLPQQAVKGGQSQKSA